MSELKPCPFCGGTNICTEKGINLNYCDNCSAEANIEHWNTRPIEDALTARIAELEAERLELRKTLGWAYDLDEYKDNPEVQKCTTNSIKLNRSNEMETKNRNQISEIRSGSTAPMGAIEVGEVTTAMSGLVSVVSKLQDSIARLEVILQPVLPQDYFECEMRVFKDGNAWCFVLPDFQDLQVSSSVWMKEGVLDKIYKELRSVRNER